MSIGKHDHSELDDIGLKLHAQLQILCDHVDSPHARAEFAKTYFLLDSLPLSTCEFDLAVSHVKNAQRYAKSCEYGAARYELRMLLSSLSCPLPQGQPTMLKIFDPEGSFCEEPTPRLEIEHEDSRFC